MHDSVPGETQKGQLSPFLPYSGELQFRHLLEKLPAGVYTCDPHGLITYFNEQAVELWGRAPLLNDPADRFCGSFKLLAADGTPISHETSWMARALRDNQEYNGHELIVQRPDGNLLTVLAFASPLYNESGELIGAVNVLMDIDDRKRAELVLRDADRAKDEFLAVLSHELRSPLAPLRNAVQMLRMEQPGGARSQWALDVVERQLEQMTRLIEDLLDVSRITRNHLELRLQRLDLASMLRAAVETSRPLIESCGHELSVSLPQQPLYLRADGARLSQAVSNLLTNAAKYTERNGQIWLHAERQGNEVVITVRDTGIGISAEMMPRMFDMFMQAEHSLHRSQGGLGIGLTLAKRLVEMHGGNIQAHSDGLGYGSTFAIYIPALPAPSGDSDPRLARDGGGMAPGPLRILIADDNRDSADSLGEILKIMGHEVRTAYDGIDACVVASEFRPDVVLLDIGMPKMDGYSAAQKLRQQADGYGMKLIAVTGWGQESDRQRARDAGFDLHMVKPVDTKALLQYLAALREAAT